MNRMYLIDSYLDFTYLLQLKFLSGGPVVNQLWLKGNPP